MVALHSKSASGGDNPRTDHEIRAIQRMEEVEMKIATLVMLATALIAPAVGLLPKEEGYLDGIEDGYEIGFLAHSALGNSTAGQMYNDLVARYNAYLERIGAPSTAKLAELPLYDNSWEPQILREAKPGDNPWG